MAGQPGDPLDVEVVGRLVESDDIPFTDQQRRQLHPTPLTAAEGGYRCFPGDVGDQAVDHIAYPRIGRPLVLGLIADQDPPDGVPNVEGVGLVELAHPQTAAPGHPAGVRA